MEHLVSKSKPFSLVVGNPPYQAGKIQDPLIIGKSPTNIFQKFQEVSTHYAEMTSLIYPGGRWASRTGKGMDEFGKWLSNYKHLHNVIYWARSFELFVKDIEVSGGVTVVFTDSNKGNEGKWHLTEFHKNVSSSGYVTLPGDRTVSLFPILNKLEEAVLNKDPKYVPLNSRKLPFSVFELSSSYAVDNPDLVVKCSENFDNIPEDDGSWVRIMVNDGHGKGGRSTWFWAKRNIFSEKSLKYVDDWKVIMSAKNINGLNGRTTQVEIIPPPSAHSFVRVCIANFKTEDEAINFFRWMKTDFVRCLIAASGSLIGSFACKVPDLLDYRTNGNSHIDFNKPESINEQLFNYYGLSSDDMAEAHKFANTLEGFSNFDY